jgi:hypothetical protein
MSAVPSAPTSYFCFGNNCFTPPISTPGAGDYTILLASGQTSTNFPMADNTKDNNQPFSIDLEEGPTTGNYVLKYKIFNVVNPNDSLTFFMGYNQPLGLKNNNSYSTTSTIMVFPNPVVNDANLLVNSTTTADASVTILNALNQPVYNKHYQLNTGANTLSFDCENIANGVYYVMFESDNNKQTKKLIIYK